MKIQILYFEGCPNHPPAVELVREVVAALNVDAMIEEVEVKGPEDCEALRFLGSPSILVDGIDVEPASRSLTTFGFCCRTYAGAGLPPRGMVLSAVKGEDYVAAGEAMSTASQDCCGNDAALEEDGDLLATGTDRSRWFLGGSVVAAIVASACCWLPLLLITFGFSAGGVGGMFEKTRPLFLALAAIFLGAGFYYIYVREARCRPGSSCSTSTPGMKRFNRFMLWISTFAVLVFALFPSYAGSFMGSSETTFVEDASTAKVKFSVDGMTCEACAVQLRNELVKVPGVIDVSVNYEQGGVIVQLNQAPTPSMEDLITDTIEDSGFTATLVEPPY